MPDRGSDSIELAPQSQSLSAPVSEIVLGALSVVAIVSLCYFYFNGLSNLYGDGLAHVEGARRLFDSRTPGYPEIGSTWLPLFHILASPLALNNFLWKTGLAGSLVSLIAYVVTGWFLFRLSFGLNCSLSAGLVSLALFALCPSMAYQASVPLTESLTLMWTVLMVYFLCRYQHGGGTQMLLAASGAAFCGTLTRYDGWYLLPFAAAFIVIARNEPWSSRIRSAACFSLISGLGPVLWFLHSAYRYGNALDFYNGPHSAKAFYAHQLATTGFRYPTDGSILISARYYVADLNWVMGAWPLELALLGLMVWVMDAPERRRRSGALLLLVPFVFYVQSMAKAAVPIYVPSLFPFTYYNLRYGIEMLPAVAIFPSFLLSSRLSPQLRRVLAALLLSIILGQDVALLANGARNLAVVQEAIRNNPCRSQRQQTLIEYFRAHYDGKGILVAAGKWPCVMPQVGISFRNTLSEPNVAAWKELQQSAPGWVEWIIRGDDDEVDQVMRAFPAAFSNFDLVLDNNFPGEGKVEVYRRHAP